MCHLAAEAAARIGRRRARWPSPAGVHNARSPALLPSVLFPSSLRPLSRRTQAAAMHKADDSDLVHVVIGRRAQTSTDHTICTNGRRREGVTVGTVTRHTHSLPALPVTPRQFARRPVVAAQLSRSRGRPSCKVRLPSRHLVADPLPLLPCRRAGSAAGASGAPFFLSRPCLPAAAGPAASLPITQRSPHLFARKAPAALNAPRLTRKHGLCGRDVRNVLKIAADEPSRH